MAVSSPPLTYGIVDTFRRFEQPKNSMRVLEGGGVTMNMKALRNLIAAILLAYGSAAIAENLVFLSTSKTNSKLYYDSDSIKREGDSIIFWVYWDRINDKTVNIRESRDLIKINCGTKFLGVMYYANYDSSGRVKSNDSYTEYPQMTPIIPGSVGETFFDAVCK